MTSATAQRLESLLRQQMEGSEQLLQLLQDENSALVNRDFGAIHRLSQVKSEQSAALDQLGKQQCLLLQELDLPCSAEGIGRFINGLTPALATQLRKKQQQLQSLLESCQRLNMVNGNIITANKHSTETALAILRGQLVPDNLVYSAGGQTVAAASSKPFTKA